jgi:hypothetical protein
MMLSRDEALCAHSAVLDVACMLLADETIDAAHLTLLNRSTLVAEMYWSVVDRIVDAGHGDIIDDQFDGYFSALRVDAGFRLLVAV